MYVYIYARPSIVSCVVSSITFLLEFDVIFVADLCNYFPLFMFKLSKLNNGKAL